jgi:fatty acid desaturase (delta-4 desaturase)
LLLLWLYISNEALHPTFNLFNCLKSYSICCCLQYGDINGLLTNRTAGATLYGADEQEKNTVLLGKLAHYTLLAGLPLLLHGPQAALIGAAAYTLTQSIVLSATFAVSHNVPESKPLQEGPTQVCTQTD